jgi:uncharacterized protein YjdB
VARLRATTAQLALAVALVRQLNLNVYTDASVARLREAIRRAESVLANANATQEQANAISELVIAAINDLAVAPAVPILSEPPKTDSKSSTPASSVINKVKASQTSVTVKVRKSVKVAASAYAPSGVTGKVTWKSSNKRIATVTSGKIVGKKIGRATITVKSANGKTAKITVKVVKKSAKAQKAVKVTVKGAPKAALKVGAYAWLTGKAPAKAYGAKVVYSSSNAGVAKVDATGRVTAVKAGKAVITVKVKGAKKAVKKVTITVTA